MRNRIPIATILLFVLSSVGFAQTTIRIEEPYSWGENVGWVNMYANGADGLVVMDEYLSGYAWGENVGWIFFGDNPDVGTQYSQSAGDTGVNSDGSGNLSGYAWGENIGWIVFDTSSSGGSQVTIDQQTGQFDGYAWSENIGWISFDTGYGVVADVEVAEGLQAWMLF